FRIDPTDVYIRSEAGSLPLDAGDGFDVWDYSTFLAPADGGSGDRVLVNLSNTTYHFDINRSSATPLTALSQLSELDLKDGEYVLANTQTGSRLNVSSGSGEGGAGAIAATGNNASIEGVIGGGADDVFVGDDDANLFVGNGGDDLIAGGAGNDTIFSGEGDDFIVPGEGADFVNGGRGINVIRVSSSDLNQDTYTLDGDGVNTFELAEATAGGSDGNVNTIDGINNWRPGTTGVDLVDGGDGIAKSVVGTSSNDTIDLNGVATRNISEVDGGGGDDTIGTATISKLFTTSYNGGAGQDTLILNLTFDQINAINQSGAFTRDVRDFIEDATSNFNTPELNVSAINFERGNLGIVAPATEYDLQGDPVAITINKVVAVEGGSSGRTVSSGADLTLNAQADAASTAEALSVADLSSALVQADQVKGVDAISFTIGGDLGGAAVVDHRASVLASSGDARTDAAMAAHGLGLDRSSLSSGGSIELRLLASVDGSSTAQSRGTVADADGTVEVAASRDTSFNAGADLT
ncbi:MAG: calcium-binding protein, partial [Prochlorococcaceae cyanobacterium]